MWIRVCDICGKRVDEEQRRFMIFKNVKIFGFTNNQFYKEKENRNRNEITICEICSKNNNIWKIWQLL